MIDYNELKEEVYKQLKNCDPFFRKPKYRELVHFYVYNACQERLGKRKHNCRITPTKKGDIMVDIISSSKRLNPFVITKRRIESIAKKFELPE